MKTEGLSINLATVRQQFDLKNGVEALVKHGIRGVSPWREHVQAVGMAGGGAHHQVERHEGHRLLPRRAVRLGADAAGQQALIDDNKRMIDEGAAIGADCLVMIGGGLAPGSRDIKAARGRYLDGMAAILPHARACEVALAVEPLHPMYAADRGCISLLSEALDVCDQLGEGTGVVIDAYHLWWDPDLEPRSRAPRAASWRITSATGWCRRRTSCSTAA